MTPVWVHRFVLSQYGRFDPDTVDYVEVGDAGGDFGDYGGAGSINDGGYCPAPWINILLADGGTVKAGDIKPGMNCEIGYSGKDAESISCK